MTLANKTEVGCTPLLHETILAKNFRNDRVMILGKGEGNQIEFHSVRDVQLFSDQRSIL